MRTAELPPITANQFRELFEKRNTQQDEFLAYVVALRTHGWPLRAMAEATGVSRTAVLKWSDRAYASKTVIDSSKSIIVPRMPLLSHGSKVKIKKIKKDISDEQAAELLSLASDTRKITRWTRKDDAIRNSADKYTQLLDLYINKRGVSISTIAKHAGVSRRAISQRLEILAQNRVE